MTYKVVIIEDEPLALKKVTRLITEVISDAEIIATLTNNEQILAFLSSDKSADVIFSDIELTDGPVFQTFSKIEPKCPVIFITAYNEYMMEAFETSGIAYLLKPFNKIKLQNAWKKFQQLTNPTQLQSISQLATTMNNLNIAPPKLKLSRITIKTAEKIYFLSINEITLIRADGGLVTAFCKNGKRHYLNENSLQKLMQKINNPDFFQINRSELVQQQYIEKLERYCKNTFAVYITNLVEPVKTSQSRNREFSQWLGLTG